MNQLFSICCYLLLLMCINVYTVDAQKRCLTSEKRAALIQKQPYLEAEFWEKEKETQKWIADYKKNGANRSKGVLTIPVVVHVIWEKSKDYITDDQIYSQIDVLNEDFRKLNENFGEGPAPFQPLGADTEIEFCLASFDPEGNFTSGITRTKTSIKEIGLTESWYSTEDGGKDAWDVDRYLNIWVCDLSDELLGFATPPGFADPKESDGVVIHPHVFGRIGTALDSEPNHLGKTGTHEVGHYLNLEHTWGPEDGGCYEDDFVEDTPPQEYESEGCPDFPSYDYCTEDGNGIMFNNYMDYADDPCVTMFTEGQKMRMLAALNGDRASLLAHDACQLMTSNETIRTASVQLFPNPAQEKIVLDLSAINGIKMPVFQIYNIQGQMVKTVQVGKEGIIDISSLPNGLYFLDSDTHSMQTIKFMIQNY